MADRRKRTGWIAGAVTLGVGAAIAGGVAATRVYARRDRNRPDPYRNEPYGNVRGRPIGPVASFDGTLLNVEEAGAGPAVVLSHGFSLSLPLWHHQILDLAPDARLVLYDHRGHGRSGVPPFGDWSLDALGRDLDAVIGDACDREPVVLVGHSMGGMAVLKYCELYPEKIGARVAGIVLVGTTSADVMGGMLPGAARRVDAAFQMLQAAAMRAFAGREDRVDRIRQRASDLAYLGTRVMGFGADPSPSQVAFVERLLGDTRSDVWLNLIPSLLAFDVSRALAAIDVPALILVGSRDRLTPIHAAERIAEGIPDAELVVIPGAGHTSMLEAHDEFNDQIRRFLARVRSASRRL